MPKTLSKEKILKLNPHIDKTLLNDSIKLSEILAASGTQIAKYNLAFPVSRRRRGKSEADFTSSKDNRPSRRV